MRRRTGSGGPVRRGDPGNAAHLDREGDGVTCEWPHHPRPPPHQPPPALAGGGWPFPKCFKQAINEQLRALLAWVHATRTREGRPCRSYPPVTSRTVPGPTRPASVPSTSCR
ncbi:excalibur calcium-binding domain-containing protein [Streptomyces sp. HB132]|uniref:excalibur calcium-binding domain-containing protein n=1 Tax=Streptomyces sp. HB132 TaxID=767388 RepID=UPI0035A94EE9